MFFLLNRAANYSWKICRLDLSALSLSRERNSSEEVYTVTIRFVGLRSHGCEEEGYFFITVGSLDDLDCTVGAHGRRVGGEAETLKRAALLQMRHPW